MPVTLTQIELSAALRLGDSAEEGVEAARLLSYATVAVSRHLGDAFDRTPDVVVNEGVIRLTAYLLDQPAAGRGMMYADALRSSGAAMILLPYRIHRASPGEAVAAAQKAVGSPGNPVTGVRLSAGKLSVTFADGTTESTPFTPGAVAGADQVARDAAAQAQTKAGQALAAATAASTAANAAQVDINDHEANHPTGGAAEPVVDVVGGRLPGAATPMRLGWSASRVFTEVSFNRALGAGSSVGTSSGVDEPELPATLPTGGYFGIWLAGEHTLLSVKRSQLNLGSELLGDDFLVADRVALTVASVAGYYYPSTISLRRVGGGDVTVAILSGGPLILTTGDLAAALARIKALEDATAGATVRRHTITFPASSYNYLSPKSVLKAPYPAGLTSVAALAALKTGLLIADDQETPVFPQLPMTEADQDFTLVSYAVAPTGLYATVLFQATTIDLALHNVELENDNQRDGWKLHLSLVS